MKRVLRPGGLLLVAEPNNFSNRTVANHLTSNLSIDEVMDRLRFALTMERGKKALGLGFNSEGDLVPGHFAELGLEEIQVFLSDKTIPFFAPYSSEEQQVNIRQMREWMAREFMGWEREEMRRYFEAGRGDSEKFDYFWGLELEDAIAVLNAIEGGKFHCGGGAMTYLVSGRKKSESFGRGQIQSGTGNEV